MKGRKEPLFCNKDGRWLVRKRKGGIEPWARILYQNYILNGEEIPKGFLIHHRDKNSGNDKIENLEMITKTKHNSIHHKGREKSIEEKRKISENKRGKRKNPHSLETRKKISEKLKGKEKPPRSLQHIENIKKNHKGMKGKTHSLETIMKMQKAARNRELKKLLKEMVDDI